MKHSARFLEFVNELVARTKNKETLRVLVRIFETFLRSYDSTFYGCSITGKPLILTSRLQTVVIPTPVQYSREK